MHNLRLLLVMLFCLAACVLSAQEEYSITFLENKEQEVTNQIPTSQSESSDTIASDELSLVKRVEDWYANNMNYWSITALMTIESSFIPFPSEVVIPPATYVASQPDSVLNVTSSYPLNVLLIILFGTLGALLGATINYFLALWLGRPIVYAFADSKLGHLLLLSSEKIKRAEDYFNKHGKVSTFVGRLIPAIRQLISIPAGLARMPFGIFIGYTALGALIWNTILAILGYIAQEQSDLIDKYNHEISIAVIALVVLILIIRYILKKKKH